MTQAELHIPAIRHRLPSDQSTLTATKLVLTGSLSALTLLPTAKAAEIKAPEGAESSLFNLDLGSGQDHISMHNIYRTTSIPNHVTLESSNRKT